MARSTTSTLNKDGPLFGAHPGNAPGITWQVGSLLPAATSTADDAAGSGWPGAGRADPVVDSGHAQLAAPPWAPP